MDVAAITKECNEYLDNSSLCSTFQELEDLSQQVTKLLKRTKLLREENATLKSMDAAKFEQAIRDIDSRLSVLVKQAEELNT
jgi:regulator of replication initiation timing